MQWPVSRSNNSDADGKIPHWSACTGFTLVELMVVVTIIVILIAMLVPALDKATGSANKVSCMTNLRAFSMGYRNYASDHRGDVIAVTGGSRDYWQYKLAPYMGFPTFGKEATVGAAKFMLCPETTVAYPSDLARNARETWNWDSGQGSYGFNLFLVNYAFPPPNGYQSGMDPPSYYHLKFDKANGRTPILGDSGWIGSWPDDHDYDPTNYHSPNMAHEDGRMMSRFCIDRHGGFTTNISCVDGSAHNTILGGLWEFPWHREFQPHYQSGGWD
jgi:prepilin-type N-terminal cleavage/methylation domain-containing protein